MNKYLLKIYSIPVLLTIFPIAYFSLIFFLGSKGYLGRCDAIPWVISAVIISPLLTLIGLYKTISDKHESIWFRLLLILTQCTFIALCLFLLQNW